MSLKYLLAVVLFACVSQDTANAKSGHHLETCWKKQVFPLQGQYLRLQYNENNDELYHSFKPWQVIHNTSKGTAWLNAGCFLKIDTLQEKYFSKEQYNDSELLVLGYGDKKVSQVTKRDHEREPIDLARYSPVLLLNYFYEHHPLPGPVSDRNYAVYQLAIEKTIVKLYIRKHTNIVEKISATSSSELYGDVTDLFVYSGYENDEAIYYPTAISIEKTNGKVRDTVRITGVSFTKEVTPVLEKPANFKMKEEKIVVPELTVEKYNDHIHFIKLEHTNGTAMVVEFNDYLLVAEAPLNSANGELIINEAKKIAPGKPIKYFVFGHYHPDYIGGMRAFIHKGAKVLCTPVDVPYIEYLAAAQHTLEPDSLQLEPRLLATEVFDTSEIITDGNYQMKIYLIGGKSEHTIDYLIYYFPAEKLLFEGDLIWIAEQGPVKKAGKRQAGLYNAVKELGLDVDTIVQSWPVANYGVKSKIAFSELEQSVSAK